MRHRTRYLVLGAGGHGKVVAQCLRAEDRAILGFLDPDEDLRGTTVEGLRVLGGDALLDSYPPDSVALVNGVGAGVNTIRRGKLYESLVSKGYVFPPLAAATAVRADSSRMESGSQLLTRAVLHPGSSLGRNAVVNTAAIIEHDCSIGDHAFVGPGAIVCGGAFIGVGAFVGAGAVLLPGVRIGKGALIAAGAVVRKDVPAGYWARGVPARVSSRRAQL